jgi:hypothetical protein
LPWFIIKRFSGRRGDTSHLIVGDPKMAADVSDNSSP